MIYHFDEFWIKKNQLIEPCKVEDLLPGDKIMIKTKLIEIDDIDEFHANDARERFHLDISEVKYRSKEEEEESYDGIADYFVLYMHYDNFEISAIPRGTVFYRKKII